MRKSLLSILAMGMIALSGNVRADQDVPRDITSERIIYVGNTPNKVESTTLNVEVKVDKLTLTHTNGKKQIKTWAEYEVKNPSRNRITRAIDIENDGIIDRVEVSPLDKSKPYMEPFSIQTAREMNYARTVQKDDNIKSASAGMYPAKDALEFYNRVYDALLEKK